MTSTDADWREELRDLLLANSSKAVNAAVVLARQNAPDTL